MRLFFRQKWSVIGMMVICAGALSIGGDCQEGPPSGSGSASSFSIEAKNPVVKAGAHVWIDITEKNISDRFVWVGRERPVDMDQGGVSFKVDVSDDKGVRAPETSFYRKLLGHLTPEEKSQTTHELPISNGFAILLKPGEAKSDRIDISRLYDLSRPGTYSVRLSYVHSNTTRITIIP